MADVLLDASVAVKLVLPEPDSILAQQTKFHRGVFSEVKSDGFLRKLKTTHYRMQQSEPFLSLGFEIAKRYDRAMYDALFVAAARALGIQGVTADLPLYNAVQADFPEIIRPQDW